jgi:tetratricopeptide (TPR) repeat protein/nucleoside-triphosphatase THEP1
VVSIPPGSLRVDLLGPPRIYFAGNRGQVRLRNRRAQALIAYLSMHQGLAISRSELVDLLWSDVSAKSRHSFSQLLYQINKARLHVIKSSSDAIWLDDGVAITDALLFDTALAKAEYGTAVELIRGDFLSGLEIKLLGGIQDWIEEQRDCYRVKFIKVYTAALEDALIRSDASAVAEMEHRLAAISPGLVASSTTHPNAESGIQQYKSQPLVGRVDELRRLRLSWEGTRKQSASQAVALTGDVGIGKTRMLQAFGEYLLASNIPFLQVSCADQQSNYALTSFTASVRSKQEESSDVGLRQALQQLAAVFARDNLLGGLTAGTAGDSAALQQFERAAVIIANIAKTRGMVLLVDEIGLADSVSRSFFAYIRRRCANRAVLFVLAQSSGYGEPLGIECENIELAPLADADAIKLARSVAKGVPVREPDMCEVVRRAGGNPHFIIELVKFGIVAGFSTDTLPTSLQILLERRLRSLSQPAIELLAAICITSQYADFEFACAAAGHAAAHAIHAQAELERSRLITYEGRSERLSIHHEVVRIALEGITGRHIMSRVARRAAALAVRNANVPAAVIAEWFERAGEDRLAYRFAMKAGMLARDRLRWIDAVEFFTKAVDLAPTQQQRSIAFQELGLACVQCGRYTEGERFLVKATESAPSTQHQAQLELARITQAVNFAASNNNDNLEDLNRLIDYLVVGDVNGLEAIAYEALVFAAYQAGDAKLIWSAIELGRIVAERLDRYGDVARIYAAAGRVASVSGDPGLGHALARDAWDIAERLDDSVAKLHALLALGSSLYFMGDLNQARSAFAQAHTLAGGDGLEQYLRLTACNLAVLLMDQDEISDARAMFIESIERDSVMQQMYCLINLCCLAADEGEWTECSRRASEAQLLNRGVGANWVEVSVLTFLGLCRVAAVDYVEAMQLATLVRERIENHAALGDLSFTIILQARTAEHYQAGIGSEIIREGLKRPDVSHVGRLRLRLEHARLIMGAAPRDAWTIADDVLEIARSTGAYAIARRAESFIIEVARRRARRPT